MTLPQLKVLLHFSFMGVQQLGIIIQFKLELIFVLNQKLICVARSFAKLCFLDVLDIRKNILIDRHDRKDEARVVKRQAPILK